MVAPILLIFVPMATTFAFSDQYVLILQSALTAWRHKSANLILSDILFCEAGFFLFFGALFAGSVIYCSRSPCWMALFVDPVFHWKIVKKEREISSTLILGLLIMIIGLSYISAGIMVALQVNSF